MISQFKTQHFGEHSMTRPRTDILHLRGKRIPVARQPVPARLRLPEPCEPREAAPEPRQGRGEALAEDVARIVRGKMKFERLLWGEVI